MIMMMDGIMMRRSWWKLRDDGRDVWQVEERSESDNPADHQSRRRRVSAKGEWVGEGERGVAL